VPDVRWICRTAARFGYFARRRYSFQTSPRNHGPASDGCDLRARWREQIAQSYATRIQGTKILSALERNHGYRGRTSSIYRFLK
jgi:hypothetical protein